MRPNLSENIDKLIKGTITGKISWSKPSEYTYIWQTANDEKIKLNIIVQAYKNPLNNTISNILFRLYDVEKKISLINIETQETTPENKGKIFDLFNTIKENFDSGRVDVLGDLLKNL